MKGRSVLAGALALHAGSAFAHAGIKGIGDFYVGALHPLSAPEHVLAFLALGILAAQQNPRGKLAVIVFCFALALGAALALVLPALPAVNVFNLASGLILGGLVALCRPMPGALLVALAAVFGLGHGFANGIEISESMSAWQFIAGMTIAALASIGYVMILVDWLLRRKAAWIAIAVRVAGSWITAIGMLVLAAGLRG